ncbi:ribosomal L1 domain-containing protein 1 [Sesamum indicum]|uniref:Ribosomal L1 domain-containing protein 1 n=1 Tax=Sesamum indicum TaxID=4182 RepID=A0A8M8V2B6_SESIN|nr:ribosomal L1 domain-containing protein 1 [Sesamum indicum]
MASKPQPPAAAAVAVDSRVSSSTVESAVNALLKYKAAHSATEKLQLLPQDDYIYLNLTLKKIPNARTNPFRIPLPHPILDLSSQICLIIDDRPQTTTPPSEEIKKLIKSQNIPISKVIKISKLKTNYKPFEAKRKLCDSYDLFLVDKRVVHLLPKLIGKQFFKKKKLPLGVDLRKSNLKLQVERALGSALLYLRTGTCCVMKVGKVAMEKDEVVENVIDAIKGAVERVPKKWDGVRSLHLKFYDSVALPIYQAMPDVKLKIEGLKEIEKRAEVAKISDSEGEVKETSGRKDGKSGKKKKGRIHEVRYMDVGEDMESGDDVDEIEQVRSVDNDDDLGQKMRGNLMVESDDDEEDKDESERIGVEDISTNETVGKKRNKGRAAKKEVLGTLNGEKRVKKKPKSEKSGDEKVKKDDVSGGEVSGGKKGKKKSELRQRRSERIAKVKDANPKKKVSAK